MSIDLNQFNEVFFEESREHLEQMEQLLMELDLVEPDKEDLNSIFRAAHSIKGGSGIFGFTALTDVTHVMENLLDRARKGEFELQHSDVDILLSTVDQLGNLLDCYQQQQEPDWEVVTHAKSQLEQLLSQTTPDQSTTEKTEDDGFGFFEPLPESSATDSSQEEDFGFFDDAPGTPETTSEQSLENNLKEGVDYGIFEKEPVEGQDYGLFQPQEPGSKPQANLGRQRQSPDLKPQKSKDSGSIRVDIQKIDNLVNLVGELVITQSMLNLIGKDVPESMADRTQSALTELERNTREIQEAVMSVRMLPMSFVFSRFPRLVRDLTSKMGKKVELHLEGQQTEIDKGLIEKVVDPLTHLVRNSLDHGIETPEQRLAMDKPEQGNLTLKAQQTGGNIVLSIIDDGAGLNRDKILAKAQESGLSIPDSPSDDQVWSLIFEPGFSTAETVTDVSGRGVGMDVVRRNIESLNGRVEVSSRKGRGSQFDIHLPLTLAILDGMCVAVGEQTFVVPLTNIVESMQPSDDQLRTLNKEHLLWSREVYWPLIDVRSSLLDKRQSDCLPVTESIVVLVESANKRFGLIVDELQGQQQVVIKSLEKHYRRVAGIAGATIMGDGSVALILDVESLASGVSRTEQFVEETL
ncbi:Histidine kinase [Saliniradius amylolyticus]|uniref:Chemotaxis protein CheA n=1 Tax=Saliniradius amylolyticus TaxID=2183582 RepID=A0A2S2E372_9ALTE|nr:chemotaxis protein CheW [Saliniradius amylolyticus]AWL12106.1 Histidine kinase [Saliniradius amylolyticus]